MGEVSVSKFKLSGFLALPGSSPFWHNHCNVLILGTPQYVDRNIQSLYLYPD